MQLIKIRSLQQYNDLLNSIWLKRNLVEKLIGEENKHNKEWKTIGFCEVCNKESRFLSDWKHSDNIVPNFRERMICEHCGLNNRQRFVAGYLQNIIKDEKNIINKIYLYEQVTNFYKYVFENYRNLEVIGSEYLGFDKEGGEIIKGIRHEDACKLSFKDNDIDIIISNDVFEHVPDIQRSLNEAYRVLKQGGRLIFSIPFYTVELKTIQRAIIENGNIINILPEEYHGNPIDKKGSLVFYNFGWDILDNCKQTGFKDAYLLAYYSTFFGYLGNGQQFIFVAEK